MKRPALQNKRVGVLRMAFRDFRETGPWPVASFEASRGTRLGWNLLFSLLFLSFCGSPMYLVDLVASCWNNNNNNEGNWIY